MYDKSLTLNGLACSYRQGIDEGRADRASGVQTIFAPKHKEEELAAHLAGAKLGKRQRDLLFDWIDVLFRDLQGTPANRGACLEGIAIVVERYVTIWAHRAASGTEPLVPFWQPSYE